MSKFETLDVLNPLGGLLGKQMTRNPPQCPYCFEGIIVRDNIDNKILFCKNCFREVEIKRHEDEI